MSQQYCDLSCRLYDTLEATRRVGQLFGWDGGAQVVKGPSGVVWNSATEIRK